MTVHGPINPAVDPEVALRETAAVLTRIEAGRLRPATPFELSYAIVSALTRHQEDYVETVTSDVWQLEQRVTGGDVDDPEEFLNELFRARHGLLAVRTMGALSARDLRQDDHPHPHLAPTGNGWSPTSPTSSTASAASPTARRSTSRG